jgi:hypothetical protein
MTLWLERWRTLNRYAKQADNTDFLTRKGIINLPNVCHVRTFKIKI